MIKQSRTVAIAQLLIVASLAPAPARAGGQFSFFHYEDPLEYFQFAVHGPVGVDDGHSKRVAPLWQRRVRLQRDGNGIYIFALGNSKHVIAPHAGEPVPGPRHGY